MLAPAGADQEHSHAGRVYCEGLTDGDPAQDSGMTLEPGLDLHERETRWEELEQALADDPAGALVEACDAIEELIPVVDGQDELVRAYAAARDTADRIERGEDVDPGDVGAAVDNLRSIRAALTAS